VTPSLWLTAPRYARLRALQPRRARMILAAWAARQGEPGVPRVERIRRGRGPLSLCVLAADLARLYAVDEADVHQLAA
jgi:hypothetical protein